MKTNPHLVVDVVASFFEAALMHDDEEETKRAKNCFIHDAK